MTQPHNASRRRFGLALGATIAALLGVLAWRVSLPSESSGTSVSMTEPHVAQPRPLPATEAAVRAPAGATGAAGMSGAASKAVPMTLLPPLGTRGTAKQWVRSKYGAAENLLGYTSLAEGAEGESRAPQGLAVTLEGDLLVLDSEKDRLVWFDPSANIKRTLPIKGLKMPADVGVAADGTIVVMDHEGVQTNGTLLLSADGKPKGMLPQSGGGSVVEMYIVGNDVFGGLGGSSMKLGDTSGVPSHESAGLYDQDGIFPGSIAPDGRTIIDATVLSRDERRIYLTALRDNPPQHIFSRQYTVPVPSRLMGLPFVQADNAGNIYVVLGYGDFQLMLLCFDSAGEPLGSIAMAKDDAMTGAAFKQFAIDRERGGLVYHHLLEGASSYEIYDCR